MTTIRVNRGKVAISPRRADRNYHFPSRVGAVGQMQTGSRLGPRNRIWGQMYKASRRTADYTRDFRDRSQNFRRFAKARGQKDTI